MYSKRALSFFLLLGSKLIYAQLKIITLEEAIDYALKNAYSIQLAEQDRKIAVEQVQEALGRGGPQLKLTGNYLRNDKEIPNSQYLDNFNIGFNASLPLDINNVIKKGVQSARFNQKAVEAIKAMAYINLRSDVKNAGYDIMLNTRIVNLNLEKKITTERNFETIKAKVENKVAAKYDQYIATRDLQTSKAAVFNSELNYKSSKKTFNNLIGSDVNQDHKLQEINEFYKLEFDKNDLLNKSYNRPDVQSLNYNIELQECKLRIELGALTPSLGVSLSYTQSQKLTSQSTPNKNNFNGGVNLTIPILDSGIAKSKSKQVEETIKKLKVQKKQLLSQIELKLENALDQLKNAYLQLEVNESALTASQEAYRIAVLRFNENQSIQLEVSAAKDSFTQVSIEYQKSFFNILKAYSEIERITGLSVEKLVDTSSNKHQMITTKNKNS